MSYLTPEEVAEEKRRLAKVRERAAWAVGAPRRVPTAEEIEAEEKWRLEYPLPTEEEIEELEAEKIFREALPLTPPSPEPTEEELKEFKRYAEQRDYSVQHREMAGITTEVSRNLDITVCLKKPMKIILQDRVTKKKVDSYERDSPPKCQTFYPHEKKCLEEKSDEPDCERVKQTFLCKDEPDLSPTVVAEAVETTPEKAESCMKEMVRDGLLVRARDLTVTFAGEERFLDRKYFMPPEKGLELERERKKRIEWRPEEGRYVVVED